jgi:hypothetical protein
MTNPQLQAIYANELSYAGLNPETMNFVTPDVRPLLPAAPENVSKQFWLDVAWWTDERRAGAGAVEPLDAAARLMRLSLRGLVQRFGTVTALGGVDLDVAEGEFLTILGPSGSARRHCSNPSPASRCQMRARSAWARRTSR